MFRRTPSLFYAALSPLLAVLLVASLTSPVWSQVDTSRSISFGEAEQNIRLHIERLNRFIRQMGKGPQLAVLDISRILTEVSLNPPVILGTPLLPPPYFGFATAVFADPIHPTAISDGILANEMIEQLNAKFDDNIPFYTEEELADLAGLTP